MVKYTKELGFMRNNTILICIYIYILVDLKKIKSEFISGFIRSISGEKDPRNLMTIYTSIQKIVGSLDITNHVEVSIVINFTKSMYLIASLL
jgi:hypothetical protein